MSNTTTPATMAERRKKRRLKPEIAARMVAQRRSATLKSLYERPAQELSPEEMAQLKAAFFRG